MYYIPCMVSYLSLRHVVIPSDCCQVVIDGFYVKLVEALKHSADQHVPARYKNYYKIWWSQELSCLKENAIQSNEIWKAGGRPRTGPIPDKRNADKRKYKRMLRSERQAELQCYSNDLHEALISKSGIIFSKCWKSKFEKDDNSMKVIDGLADDSQIAQAFAVHFRKICTNLNEDRHIGLRNS